jgi:hypothetical protein
MLPPNGKKLLIAKALGIISFALGGSSILGAVVSALLIRFAGREHAIPGLIALSSIGSFVAIVVGIPAGLYAAFSGGEHWASQRRFCVCWQIRLSDSF